jgi:outer membrane protein assembly factor BamB
MWGFSGSPLVVGKRVIVFAGGDSSQNLLAYHVETGNLEWASSAGQTSYASPHPATIKGVEQILVFSNKGLTAVAPASGDVLWEHSLPLPPSAPRSVQPYVLSDGVLVGSEGDIGLALIDLERQGKTFTPTQRWDSQDLKPAFNDFVVHQGHAYGFDGRIFCCVELDAGSKCWKKGRYGHGQVLLLAEQSLLLVVTEKGKVVLLRATPEGHEELGQFQALKGKTWNHPVIAHGRLYVRNAEEMACYELGMTSPRGRDSR